MSGHQLKDVLNGFGCGLYNGRDRCGHGGSLLEDGRMSVVEALSIPAAEQVPQSDLIEWRASSRFARISRPDPRSRSAPA